LKIFNRSSPAPVTEYKIDPKNLVRLSLYLILFLVLDTFGREREREEREKQNEDIKR
jgi:hypothetical protein